VPSLDVARARALTPGCGRVLHLNHAGASLAPQPVLDAVVGHLQLEAEIGGYEAADAAADRLESVYASLGRLLGARADDVALVESATAAWNAVVLALPVEAGQRVVCTRTEYGSNAIVLLQLAERTGCEIVVVDDGPDGEVDLDAFERALVGGPVAFASLVHVPTGEGLVQPASEVGRLCRAAGVPLVLDACQSVGQLALDVSALGCSVLVGSGRKYLRGPRGTGFLWVDPALLPRLRPMALDMRGADWVGPAEYRMREDVRRFEQFEASYAARLGLGAAVDHALGWGLEAIEARVTALGTALRERLAEIPGVRVHDRGRRRCGITSSTVEGAPGAVVARRLRSLGINTSVSIPSFAQLDVRHRTVGDLLRASVHYVTTDDELDRAAAAIREVAETP
jgi:selenocysteine lyase/cysteine desulfurase